MPLRYCEQAEAGFRAVFDEFDADGSGTLTVGELVTAVMAAQQHQQQQEKEGTTSRWGKSSSAHSGGSSATAEAAVEQLMRDVLRKESTREKLKLALETFDTGEQGVLKFEELLAALVR